MQATDVLRFLAHFGSDTQTQGVQFDETVCVFLVVSTGIVFESGDIGVEQGIVAEFATDDDDVAFVQLEANRTVDVFLCMVNQLLERDAFRGLREPL